MICSWQIHVGSYLLFCELLGPFLECVHEQNADSAIWLYLSGSESKKDFQYPSVSLHLSPLSISLLKKTLYCISRLCLEKTRQSGVAKNCSGTPHFSYLNVLTCTRGICIAKGITILCGETFVCHCFRKTVAHPPILYNVNSLTNSFISFHIGWDWTSCAKSVLIAQRYWWEWGNVRRKDRVIKCLGTLMWQQNTLVMLWVINRDHQRLWRQCEMTKKARSACEMQKCMAHSHNSHSYTSN